MTNDEALMAQALEALESPPDYIVTMKGLSHDYQVTKDAAIAALRDRLAQLSEPSKLWLWRNHVDGRPEYWAFDNPFPVHDNGDPQTLGDPCGYALLKKSRNGRPDVPEEAVMQRIKPVAAVKDSLTPEQEPVAWLYREYNNNLKLSQIAPPPPLAFPVYTAPPTRTPLTDEHVYELARKTGVSRLTDLLDDDQWNNMEPCLMAFARAVERAHGIGEGK